jgi:hypothetical protein
MTRNMSCCSALSGSNTIIRLYCHRTRPTFFARGRACGRHDASPEALTGRRFRVVFFQRWRLSPYAILSHTWTEDQEVTYIQDLVYTIEKSGALEERPRVLWIPCYPLLKKRPLFGKVTSRYIITGNVISESLRRNITTT